MARTQYQQCSICRARQPLTATRCDQCGAALHGFIPESSPRTTASVRARSDQPDSRSSKAVETQAIGEIDLYEGSLPPLPVRFIAGALTVLVVLIGIAILVFTQLPRLNKLSEQPTSTLAAPLVSSGTRTLAVSTPPPTNTKPAPGIPQVIPTDAILPTNTPEPPTATITPTRGPCIQKARQGDTLFALAARCGHRDLSIIQVILDANNMKDAGQLQVGQTVEIPWPTPKGGATPAGNASGNGTPGTTSTAANPDDALAPGQQWYTVRKGDTAIGIAVRFKANMKVLHDMNPQITFDQCDFSTTYGGPNCNLLPPLAPGVRLRVPAPLPTPTLSPTPNGSETATPSVTPTFNQPSNSQPSDGMVFESNDIPTLRWTTTGTLSTGQVYLLTVEDVTGGQTYSATTSDNLYPLSPDWQPSDGRNHTFVWTIAVATFNTQNTPVPSAFESARWTFVWKSR
jgi:hypothetical protein